MSQHELAIEAELSRSYVVRIENKTANLKISTIQALSEALEVEPAEFFRPLREEG